MKKVFVSPSILAADFNNLKSELELMENSGASLIHFDVMDGHFVKNISFGVPVLKSICRSHHLINDVHIMVSDPLTYGPIFAKNGADIVTFHYEAVKDEEVMDVINAISKENCRVGLAIKPGTSVESILKFLPDLDLILVMSVEPGFGGQAFQEQSLEKIRKLRAYIDENNLSVLIEVDGGINDVTGARCVAAGVDVLVAGSYLFNKSDVKKRIALLKGEKDA